VADSTAGWGIVGWILRRQAASDVKEPSGGASSIVATVRDGAARSARGPSPWSFFTWERMRAR